MELAWIELIDTALKIGLGSLIAAVSGFLVIKLNHNFENKKYKNELRIKNIEDQKIKYVEFMAQASSLVQSYLFETIRPDGDDYKDYLKIYHEVQIISSPEIRVSSYNLHISVNEIVSRNKNHEGTERDFDTLQLLRDRVNEKMGLFLAVANKQVVNGYEKI